MPVSDLQREVATIALKAAAEHGFVLGGGNALILHGIVDRYTADVDLVTDRTEGVKAAAGAGKTRCAPRASRRNGRTATAASMTFSTDSKKDADAGRRLDRLSDKVFARYGLGPEDLAQLRKRFASWPRS